MEVPKIIEYYYYLVVLMIAKATKPTDGSLVISILNPKE